MIEEGPFEPGPEALRSMFGQIDVLIHMKGSDATPINSGLAQEGGQHLGLAGRGGEDHAQGWLVTEAGAQCGADVAGGEPAKFGARLSQANFHGSPISFPRRFGQQFARDEQLDSKPGAMPAFRWTRLNGGDGVS